MWARACGCGGPSLPPRPACPVGAARRGAGPWHSCAGRRAGGGGGHAPYPPFVRPGGGLLGGGSLCLVPSLCLPWAGNKEGVTGVVVSMGGVAPHTTPVCAHPPSLGAICAASWRIGAGSLVLRGPRGSRRLGPGGGSRSGSSPGRGGDHPPCLGGWGPGPPRLAGRWGGGGGGSRRGLPAPLLGGGLRYSILAPLVSSARSLPVCACGRGRSAAPGWGGAEGRPVDRSPGGPCRPEPPLCPPCVGCGHGWVMWGAAPILFRCARCSGMLVWARPAAATPAGAGPAASLPPASRSLLGAGGVPSAPGGRRAAPVAP